MKKYIIAALGFLGITTAQGAAATTTAISVPSISEGLGIAFDVINPMLSGFWPIIWLIIGIIIIGWIFNKLTGN